MYHTSINSAVRSKYKTQYVTECTSSKMPNMSVKFGKKSTPNKGMYTL